MSQQKLIEQGYVVCPAMAGFAAHIGPFFEKAEQVNGETVITRALVIDERHLNPEGVVHGGVTLTFMDYIIYRAIGDELTHNIQFATINLNTNFLAAAKQGQILYGQAKVNRKTRSVVFGDGEIYTEERSVMTGSGIWKIIGQN